MFSASCSPHMLVLQQATVSAVHVRTQYMHVGALPLTHRLAHSLVPKGAPSWNLSELGSCRPPCLSRFLPVCPYQLCLQDDIMFPAGQQPSQPTLVVCLLWDCRKSQRNIHSVRLGKPISYFSLDQSGLESLSRSLFFVCLSVAPLFPSHVHSLYLHLTLSATSLQIVLYLPHLFMVYVTMFHSLCAVFFLLP